MRKKFTKKYITPTIDSINSFSEKSEFIIDIKYLDIETKKYVTKSCPIIIENNEGKNGLKFSIIIDSYIRMGGIKYKESYGLNESLLLYNGKDKLVVDCNSVTNFKTSLPKYPLVLEGVFTKVKKIYGRNYKNTYRRTLINLSQDEDITYPTLVIESERIIKYDDTMFDTQGDDIFGIRLRTLLSHLIEVKIHGYDFHIYAIKDYKSLIIDSLQKLSYKLFKKITYIIRLAYALLCGKLYRNEAAYISSIGRNFKKINSVSFESELPSIITDNCIVDYSYFFNYYGKLDNSEKESLKEFHKYFSSQCFSDLCNNLFKSVEFRRSIELLVNASSTNDLIQQGALYSVSIETIANFMETQIEGKPPVEKLVASEIRRKMCDVLMEYKSIIDDSAYEIFKKKIDNMNQSTNADRLKEPFILYGIKLTYEDLQILKYRNSYLHGRQPDGVEEVTELQRIAIHLHYLIAILVLKFVNYSGHSIYLPQWKRTQEKSYIEAVERYMNKQLKIMKDLNKNKYSLTDRERGKLVYDLREKLYYMSEILTVVRII